ncbi:MAG: rod shape-determining protein MreC [Acidimicrobiales bacterium]|nr:rod shape-determining protein MreC [Acidimicrobiales bacterium]
MALPRRSGRRRFTLALLVLTSVTLLTLDFRGFEPIDRARSAMLSVLAPVGDVASSVFRPVTDRWDAAFNSDAILAENEQLRARVDELEGRLTSGSVAEESLQQLLEQVGIPFVGDIPTVQAKVVSGAVSNFDTTLELDKGSSVGIARAMPVVTGRGLIGRVVQVSDSRSRVQLLTDGDMQVGFNVVGTPIIGTARGTGRAGQLTGTVDLARDVAPGQLLVTSGLAGSPYPAGIPIGTITEVRTDEGAQEKTLDITMLADVFDLTFASVVLYTPPS